MTKAKTLLGRDARVESSRVKGQSCSAMRLRSFRFYGDGVSLGLSLANHLTHVLPDGARVAQPRQIPVRRILGGWWDIGLIAPLSFCPFRILPVGGSSLCIPYGDTPVWHIVTHASYSDAQPGQVVLVSGPPHTSVMSFFAGLIVMLKQD